MANIGTLTARLGLDTKDLRAGTTRARGMFSGLEKGATGSLGAITASVGKLAAAFGVVAVGAKLIGAFKNMITIGADFQYTMATVGGVMRATADEMKSLTAIAKKMGETTEWTASQAGDALRFLGMAGFSAAKAVKALPGVLDLATAGNIELGRAADIASNALTAMNLPVKDLTRVNDVFIGTITRSNVNMEQMAESFKYAAPVARAYGYTVEELSGMIGALGDAGIQGSLSGTMLRRSMLEASKIAKQMGFESSNLVDVLQSLKDIGEEDTVIMERFGMRAAAGIGAMLTRIPEIREFQNTLMDVGGEAARLADIMRKTVKGSFAELKSVIQSVAIDAFGRFEGSLSDTLQSMINWVRENKKQMVMFIEAFTSGLSTVASVLGHIVDVISSFTGAIVDFFDAADKRMRETVETAMKSGEAIRAALQPPELTGWDRFVITIENTLNNLWAVIKLVIRTAGTAISALVRTVLYGILIEGLRNVAQAIIDLVGIIAKVPAALSQWSLAPLEEPFNRLKKTVAKMTDDMVVNFSTAGEMFVKNWDKYISELEQRSAEQVAAERFFEGWVKKADEETLKVAQIMLSNLEQAGITLQGTAAQQMHTAMTMYLSPIATASQKIRDEIAKTHQEWLRMMSQKAPTVGAPRAVAGIGGIIDVEAQRAALDKLVSMYAEMAASTDVTVAEMKQIWQSYAFARVKQINAEAEALQEAFPEKVEAINAWVEFRKQKLNEEFVAFQQHLDRSRKLHREFTDNIIADIVLVSEANTGAFNVVTEEFAEAEEEKRKEAYETIQFIGQQMDRWADAAVASMRGVQIDLKRIFKQMAYDFWIYFLKKSLTDLEMIFARNFLKMLMFFDVAANDRMAMKQGERFVGFFSKGAQRAMAQMNLAPAIASAPVTGLRASAIPAFESDIQRRSDVQVIVNVNAPITSDQFVDFVVHDMVPIIERASELGQSKIALEPFVQTGDANAIID